MSDGQEPQTQPNNETPPEAEPTTPETPQTFDADYVKKLRAEAAQHRKTARDAQAQLDALQKAQEAAEAKELEQQGEFKQLAEKARAEVEQLRQELEAERNRLANEQRNRAAIGIATQLGAIDPTDANFTAAVSGVDISAEDADTQIRQALEALREARPYLFQVRRGAPLSAFNPAQGPKPEPRETDAERRARLYSGGGRQYFDPEAAVKAGGGLVWPKGEPET